MRPTSAITTSRTGSALLVAIGSAACVLAVMTAVTGETWAAVSATVLGALALGLSGRFAGLVGLGYEPGDQR